MRLLFSVIQTFIVFLLVGCGSSDSDDPQLLSKYLITASTTDGGAVSPSSVKVSQGQITSFQLTANTGFTINTVTGCGGVLDGNIYTTGKITENCIVSVEYAQTQIKIVGKVADGYLVGAKVCLDLNTDGQCSADEPASTTKEGGSYTIEGVYELDQKKFPLVVEVPSNAIDEDTNLPVGKSYILTSPAGYSDFISPISSMVHALMQNQALTLNEAKEQITTNASLSEAQHLALLEDYISGENITDQEKLKLHNIAKITAHIMSENNSMLIKALNEANSDYQMSDLSNLITQKALDQLPEISALASHKIDNSVFSVEELQGLKTTLNTDNVAIKFELSQSQTIEMNTSLEAQSAAGSTDQNDEIPDDHPDHSSFPGFFSEPIDALKGTTLHLEILNGAEVKHYFEVTDDFQDVRIFHKDLQGDLDYGIFDSNGDKVNGPLFRAVNNGWLLKSYSNVQRLKKGIYTIVFEEDDFFGTTLSDVHIVGDTVEKSEYIFGDHVLSPYTLTQGNSLTAYGSLNPWQDWAGKTTLLDIIPVRITDFSSIVQLSLSDISSETQSLNIFDLSVTVKSALYPSANAFPNLVAAEDAVIWQGSVEQLKSQRFIFNKQEDKDAYYIIIEKPLIEGSNIKQDKIGFLETGPVPYGLTIKSSIMPPPSFSLSNNNYVILEALKPIGDLTNILKLENNGLHAAVDKKNEFLSRKNDAANLISAAQTMKAVVEFDEGAYLRFYEEFTNQIDGITATNELIFLTDKLMEVAVKSFTGDSSGLIKGVLDGIAEAGFDKSRNVLAKQVGASFLRAGFEILTNDYADKKRALLTSYHDSVGISADKGQSEIHELYILQSRAVRLIHLGMNVYKATTNLEAPTEFEFLLGRLKVLVFAFSPDSSLFDLAVELDGVNSMLDKISKSIEFGVDVMLPLATVWSELLDDSRHFNYYNDDVQEQNILKLKAAGFQFEPDPVTKITSISPTLSLINTLNKYIVVGENFNSLTVLKLNGATCIDQDVLGDDLITIMCTSTETGALNFTATDQFDITVTSEQSVSFISQADERVVSDVIFNDVAFARCVQSHVTTAGVNHFALLTSLNCANKGIVSVDELAEMTDLTSLRLNNNNITDINLDKNLALLSVNIQKNSLTQEVLDYLATVDWIEDFIYENDPTVDLDRGLVAHYQFDGNADDSTLNSSHGTGYGGVSYTQGKEGQAVYLDGVDDYIIAPAVPVISSFSVSVWIKGDMVGLQSIVEQHDATTDNGFFLAVRDGGKVGSRNTIIESLVTADSWTHIVYTAQSGTESIFINGELKQTNNSAPILSSSNQQLYIGNENALGWAFSGTIDELRFYDRPINAAEVKEIFQRTEQSTFGKLNDTGITTCGDETSNDLTCPVSGFEGQDGDFGRDSNNNTNKDSDGHAGFSFTKISTQGTQLGETETDWACIRDNVTGLMWEKKTDAGLHSKYHRFSWFNSTGINDGGNAGTSNRGVCHTPGKCDTEKYVESVNAEKLCTFEDWRLPTIDELNSIADYNKQFIDKKYFPNTNLRTRESEDFWSSTPVSSSSLDLAWMFDYYNGKRSYSLKRDYYHNYIRLVRVTK